MCSLHLPKIVKTKHVHRRVLLRKGVSPLIGSKLSHKVMSKVDRAKGAIWFQLHNFSRDIELALEPATWRARLIIGADGMANIGERKRQHKVIRVHMLINDVQIGRLNSTVVSNRSIVWGQTASKHNQKLSNANCIALLWYGSPCVEFAKASSNPYWSYNHAIFWSTTHNALCTIANRDIFGQTAYHCRLIATKRMNKLHLSCAQHNKYLHANCHC